MEQTILRFLLRTAKRFSKQLVSFYSARECRGGQVGWEPAVGWAAQGTEVAPGQGAPDMVKEGYGGTIQAERRVARSESMSNLGWLVLWAGGGRDPSRRRRRYMLEK